ncbi:tRNA dimethylallyltransferase [hydrothermal vent metagenome]|uniref:tRNA dimethylallyltransferase n=1 Tax=hydrothermal vent metagenome TaxID=652676 RepID=A0A3B0SF24_9ZZZZ
MQVYRGMDIGTAKPDRSTRQRIDYRMLDVCDPDEELSVQRFQELARHEVAEILGTGGRVVIAGGSGLHFRTIVDAMTFAPTDREVRARLEARSGESLVAELLGSDPLAGDVVDLANPRRVLRAVEVWRLTGQTPTQRAATPEALALARYEPVLEFVGFGIDGVGSLDHRIRKRLTAMVEAGLPDEAAGLQGRMGRTASQAVGYRQYSAALDGEMSESEAFDATVRATNALVKRQRTFFRRDPRIRWITCQDGTEREIETAVTTIGEAMRWSS